MAVPLKENNIEYNLIGNFTEKRKHMDHNGE